VFLQLLQIYFGIYLIYHLNLHNIFILEKVPEHMWLCFFDINEICLFSNINNSVHLWLSKVGLMIPRVRPSRDLPLARLVYLPAVPQGERDGPQSTVPGYW
jgi:hypothetical protein